MIWELAHVGDWKIKQHFAFLPTRVGHQAIWLRFYFQLYTLRAMYDQPTSSFWDSVQFGDPDLDGFPLRTLTREEAERYLPGDALERIENGAT
jgi:hypothetical protein